MDKKSTKRHSLLMPKDEQLEHRYGPKNSNFSFFGSSSSSSNSFGSNSNEKIKQQNNELGGPLNVFRRSIRQINPFKNNFFRLPATPRLSRSKKVLGRGEDFTNWNFERPNKEDNFISPNNSFEKCRENIWESKMEKRNGELNKKEIQYSQLTINNNEHNDLNEFLNLMNKINKNKKEIGGSCRLPSNSNNLNEKNFNLFLEENLKEKRQRGGETVGVLNNKFTEFYNESLSQIKNGRNGKVRSRPCIPSFYNEEKTCLPPIINKQINSTVNQNLNNCYNMLPNTHYAPDGEIYAACWNKKQQIPSYPLPPPPQTQYKSQRPNNLLLQQTLKEEENEQQKTVTKSPSHSAITLLGFNNVIQKKNDTIDVEKKIQFAPQPSSSSNNIRFPRTQLLQRRRSAAASSPSENLNPFEKQHQRPQRSRSNREKSVEGEFEKSEKYKQWNGSYYGREVIKLMEHHLKRQNEREINKLKNNNKIIIENETKKEEENKIKGEKFKKPSIIFPFEEELFFNSFNYEKEQKINFIERKWIFDQFKNFLIEEETKIVLLVGETGTGKSSILRLLIENSCFGKGRNIKKKLTNTNNSPQQQQQQNKNNTVDSGIVVSEISTVPSPLSSQTSLNEETFSEQNSDFSSLDFLSQQVCAFHFCHLYDAKTCSIPEFVCSLCAQLCTCTQLKYSYGNIIRTNSTLYQLATNYNYSLNIKPLDLFRQLILQPIYNLYNKNEINLKNSFSTSSLSISDQFSKEKLPEIILIIVDAIDEANFHQNEANESFINLLINSINEWPKQLKFICTSSINSNLNKFEFLNIFGSNLKLLENYVKFIELNKINCVEDGIIFVEKIMKTNPLLEKKLTTQLRRHSFFTEENNLIINLNKQQTNNSDSVLFNKFASNLVNRVNSNFYCVLLVLNLFEESKLMFASIPQNSTISQIYLIYFQHKFPSINNFRSTISPILSVLIASLEPLTIDQLANILNISSDLCNNEEFFNEQILSLWPLIGLNPLNKKIIPMHSSLRDWLLGDGNKTEFSIDIRHGHILIALWLITTYRKTSEYSIPSPKQLFELSHHLLKANPHKYAQSNLINSKIGIKMPWSKNAQIKWLLLATEKDEENKNLKEAKETKEKCFEALENALLYQKNIFYTNLKISKFLLIAGANPNAYLLATEGGKTLLSEFTNAENIEMIKILLKFGADPNLGNPLPLLFAVQKQNKEIIKLLCNSGSDPFIEGNSVLLFCVENNYSCEIILILLNANGKVDNESIYIENHSKHLPSISSSSSNFSYDFFDKNKINKSTLQFCTLNKNNSINKAFQLATKLGYTKICNLFLDFVCKNSKFVLDSSEALSTACLNNHSDLINLFLSKGIKPYKYGHKSWNGRLPLNSAIENCSLDLIVKILNNEEEEELNSIINTKEGIQGFTPLIIAARYGHVGLVDLIINRGANLDKQDNQGRTPIFYAIEEGHFSTACILLEKGCNPCIIDFNGNSLLHLLAKRPNRGLIGQLIEIGISLEGRNGQGYRPIELAIQNAQLQSIDIFLRRGARLRSLTWQIAYETHPPLILMLLRKLLEDAQFLIRKRRNNEAEHRFNYALQKFVEIENFGKKLKFEGENNLIKEENEEEINKEKDFEFLIIKQHVKRFKIHTLHSMAVLKRKGNRIEEALNLLNEAIEIINEKECKEISSTFSSSEDEDNEIEQLNSKENNKLKRQKQRLFELYLLRAKCHFDARNMANARLDAHLATCLHPEDQEARSLATILNIN